MEGCRLKHGSGPSHHLSWVDAVCRAISDLTDVWFTVVSELCSGSLNERIKDPTETGR